MPVSPQLSRLLSRREAKELLGVSATTLWRLVVSRQLPAVRIGARRLLFTLEDLHEFVKRSRREARP